MMKIRVRKVGSNSKEPWVCKLIDPNEPAHTIMVGTAPTQQKALARGELAYRFATVQWKAGFPK